jgi:NADH:ubiquinone oxidoreductase subunit 3 (subunit A)
LRAKIHNVQGAQALCPASGVRPFHVQQSTVAYPRFVLCFFMRRHSREAPPMSFYDSWSAIMIAAIAGFVLVFSALLGARLLAPYAKERGKGVSYECGMLPIGRNWAQVHVRYYLIAILFLIFDVETVFIFPWAVTVIHMPKYVFYEMLVFIGVLAAGLAYAWRRGVLEWR